MRNCHVPSTQDGKTKLIEVLPSRNSASRRANLREEAALVTMENGQSLGGPHVSGSVLGASHALPVILVTPAKEGLRRHRAVRPEPGPWSVLLSLWEVPPSLCFLEMGLRCTLNFRCKFGGESWLHLYLWPSVVQGRGHPVWHPRRQCSCLGCLTGPWHLGLDGGCPLQLKSLGEPPGAPSWHVCY